METIVINKVEWKRDKNDKDYLSVHDGTRWLSYFLPKETKKENFNNCFNVGSSFEAEVVQNGSFFNLTNVSVAPSQTDSSSSQPQDMRTEAEKTTNLQVPEEVKEELNTSSGEILTKINIIVKEITGNPNLPRDMLLSHELSLSAWNVMLSQKLAQNNAEAKTAEFEFKKQVDIKVIEIMSGDTTIKKTPAKEKAEFEFQEDKAKLLVLQNNLYSVEIIHQSINTLIFSIKNKIKQ